MALCISGSVEIHGACPSCGKKMANIPGLHVTKLSAGPSYFVISFSLLYSASGKLFNGVYDFKRVKKYLGILVNVGLIAQRGVNKYGMTDKGIEAINEISHNSESLIYEFCNKYNLEL